MYCAEVKVLFTNLVRHSELLVSAVLDSVANVVDLASMAKAISAKSTLPSKSVNSLSGLVDHFFGMAVACSVVLPHEGFLP